MRSQHQHHSDTLEFAPEHAADVPTTLRAARLEQGLRLDDVAAAIRIRPGYLEALEDGRYADLPGAAYVSGFIRGYAEYLGLDPEEMARRYRVEAAAPKNPQSALNFPQPVSPGSRFPGGMLLALCLTLAGSVYGAYYYMTTQGGATAVAAAPPLPERLATELGIAAETPTPSQAAAAPLSPIDEPPTPTAATPLALSSAPAPSGDAAAPPSVDAASSPETVAAASAAPVEGDAVAATAAEDAMSATAAIEETATIAAEEPADAQAAAEATTEIAAAQPSPPEPPAEAPAGRVFGAGDAARVVIRATEDSWVQIRDAAGDLLLVRILKPGDVYNVPPQPGVTLRTGNAGGLDILVDGRSTPKLGETGDVLRNVALDPERLLSGSAIGRR